MIIICNDKQEIVNKAADKFVEIARAAISKHGIFTAALSGGSTPAELYSMLPAKLSHSQVDINKIHLFWGDERSVPPDHKESNYRMARETLIKGLSLPDSHIHRIKAEKGKDAARAYEKEISDFFKLKNGEMPKFNLILLGLGEDGHTASLFPGCLPVTEDKKLVSAVFVKQLQTLRFTLTPEVINSAFTIIFLVSGKKKARSLSSIIDGEYNPDRFPAQIVRSAKAEEVIWFIDKEAAQYLKHMPKVSIIIPTYDRSFYIEDAIHSVLEQSYKDYELIVVDDGSTDNTKTILQRFSKSIKYIYQEHKGVSAARNTGIASAAGEYITFLDSDDLWTDNKLKEQIAFMDNNPEALICYTDEIWIRRGKRVNPMKKHAKFSGWIFEKCLPLCIISPSSVLMRRQLFDRTGLFDDKLPVCEDYDLWLRVSLAYPIFLIEKRLIVKRGGHSDQLSGKMRGNDRYRIIALEKILQNPNLTTLQRKLVLQQLARKCAILYNGYKKRGKKEASEYKRKMEQYKCEYSKKLDICTNT